MIYNNFTKYTWSDTYSEFFSKELKQRIQRDKLILFNFQAKKII